MKLPRNAWYTRLFFWALDIWDEFTGRGSWQYRERTNVCHFVRVIVLWMPLVLALHVLFVAYAIGILVALPIFLFSLASYFKGLGTIALLIGGVWSTVKYKSWRKEQRRAQAREAPREIPEPRPAFFSLVKEAVVSQKSKICPTITFVAREESRDAA